MSTPRERRIYMEIKQMFETPDIVSIQDIDPKSIDVTDNNLMDILLNLRLIIFHDF